MGSIDVPMVDDVGHEDGDDDDDDSFDIQFDENDIMKLVK